MIPINIYLDSLSSASFSGSEIPIAMSKLYPTNSYSFIGIKNQAGYLKGSASYDSGTDILNYNLNPYEYTLNTDNNTQTIITKNGLSKRIKYTSNKQSEYKDVKYIGQYPFAIELTHIDSSSAYLKFSRYDGQLKPEITSSVLQMNTLHHFICQKTGSNLEMYIDGLLVSSGSDYSNIDFTLTGSLGETRTDSDTFIGSLGGYQQIFTGNVDELKIFNNPLTTVQAYGLATNEISGSYNWIVGNVFYEKGLITIASPTLNP